MANFSEHGDEWLGCMTSWVNIISSRKILYQSIC